MRSRPAPADGERRRAAVVFGDTFFLDQELGEEPCRGDRVLGPARPGGGAGPAPRPGKISAHPRRLHPARVPDHTGPRPCHVCDAAAGLHLLRADRRHHPEQDALHHRRRLSRQPHAQHDLHHHPAERVAGGPGHLRRHAAHQRAHRHEGDRHQPLPRRVACAGDRAAGGERALRLRRTLRALGQPPAGGAAQRHQGQTRADLLPPRPEVDVRQTGNRKAGQNLLLPVLRSRPRPLRQRHRFRDGPRHLHSFPPHLRHHRPLGAAGAAMDLRERLGENLPGRCPEGLPALRGQHLPRARGKAPVFQEGKPSVARDELRAIAPLHSRPQPERL